MDIEHLCFLSWFSDRSGSHEQDGETLRCGAPPRIAAVSSDPAMAFEPRLCRNRTCGPAFSGGTAAGHTADASAIRSNMHGIKPAQTQIGLRRMFYSENR
jgi:hypothetical protein